MSDYKWLEIIGREKSEPSDTPSRRILIMASSIHKVVQRRNAAEVVMLPDIDLDNYIADSYVDTVQALTGYRRSIRGYDPPPWEEMDKRFGLTLGSFEEVALIPRQLSPDELPAELRWRSSFLEWLTKKYGPGPWKNEETDWNGAGIYANKVAPRPNK